MTVPENELAKIREDATTLLQGTARVWRKTETTKSGGGQQRTWAPGPNVKARIAPLTGRGSTGLGPTPGDLIDDRTTNIITLEAGVGVDEGDQIEYGGKGLFEVLALPGRSFDEFVVRCETVESAEQIEGVGSGVS